MNAHSLHVLICDDNVSFAQNLVADLRKKLQQETELSEKHCFIKSLSRLSTLRQLSQNKKEAPNWDVVFCDLGWGDLTLEGIQVLHDFQLSHPNIFTVLYTAQEENESVEQALEWKLHFIDKVLRVGEKDFLDKMATLVAEQWAKKDATAGAPVGGIRLLPQEMRDIFSEKTLPELKRLREKISLLLQKNQQKGVTAAIDLSSKEVKIKLKTDPALQIQQRFAELIRNVEQFPKVETHDLVALSKPAYIRFVQEQYGGFPQMAKATGLDLNNIYRVNRRFKNSPFVVFKYDTIEILFSPFEMGQRMGEIQKLLCPVEILRKESAKNV